MGIEFRSNVDFKAIRQEIEKRRELGLKKGMEEAARDIVKRTQSGADADGGSFAPYTSGYARYKFVGRKRGGFGKNERAALKRSGVIRGSFSGFGKVDLTLSGQMLRSITSSVYRQGSELIGRIFFSNAHDAAKARGNMQKRNFFALSASQIEKIKQRIQEALNNG